MVSLRNLNTKPSQRFDFLLFFYVMGLLIGSAVWLRLIPSGDLSGRGIQTPLWLEPFGSGRSEEGRPLVQSDRRHPPMSEGVRRLKPRARSRKRWSA